MAFTLNNLIGFETDGLEEAESTSGTPDPQSTVVRTGGFSLLMPTGSEVYRIEAFEGGTSDAGDQYVLGFALRLTDITPATATTIVAAIALTSGNPIGLRIDTNGDLLLRDANLATIATESSPFTVDTWHYIELYWENAASGVAEVFIDDVQVISVSAQDFVATGGLDRYLFAGLVSDEDLYYDDIYAASGLTAASDRLGPSEVIPYRSDLNSVTPDVGTDLDSGTWLAVQAVPFSGSVAAQYDNTGDGAVNTDDVGGSAGTGGPDTDANITGAINGIKAINRMERGTGPLSDHFILLGNDTDGTTRSADLDPGTSAANFFFVSEAATIVPTSSEFQQIGFETTGAQNFECYGMLANILHTPAVADVLMGQVWM